MRPCGSHLDDLDRERARGHEESEAPARHGEHLRKRVDDDGAVALTGKRDVVSLVDHLVVDLVGDDREVMSVGKSWTSPLD